MYLYVATSNLGKLRDFAYAVQAFPRISLESLPNLAAISAPEEDAPTFEGNAILKARAYSQYAPGEIILADDSGLEVDALGGAPGVRSARFAEDRNFTTNRSLPLDQRNNLCLLDALASTREYLRTARFRCVLALARDGEILAAASGSVEGEILAVPRGSGRLRLRLPLPPARRRPHHGGTCPRGTPPLQPSRACTEKPIAGFRTK